MQIKPSPILSAVSKRMVPAIACAATTLAPMHLNGDQLLELRNPLEWERPNAGLTIDRERIDLGMDETVTGVQVDGAFATFEVPFQLDDLNGDGEWDELYFQVAFQGNAQITARLATGTEGSPNEPDPRTDAMADAAARPDIAKPAWESELMTYVSYGAAQVDAIGKIMPQLSIDFMYREPTSSQHRFTVEHGKDFMQVINTMGAHAPFVLEPDGTIVRPWSTDAYTVQGPLERDAQLTSRVISSGPLRAIVETRIDQWSSDLGDYACTLRYTIEAGQRHTNVSIVYDAMPAVRPLPRIGAGTRAFEQDLFLRERNHSIIAASRNVLERGTLIPWMGRAIFAADTVDLDPIRIPDGAAPEGIVKSGPNYGAVFPENRLEANYTFLSSWNFDDAITSWEQFQETVDQLQDEISNPIEIVSQTNIN